MPTAASVLIERTRRFVRDWPDEDVLTASVASGGLTLTVADGTQYKKNFHIELESETLTVAADGTGTSVTVRRGAHGTTAASHASATVILRRPHFEQIEILDALNAGIAACYPLIYKEVVDDTLTTLTNTFEYTIPSTLQRLSGVELKYTGDANYLNGKGWKIRRGATPKLVFSREPESGAGIRLHGFGPFPALTTASTLDAQWPLNAEDPLILYAASTLTASGETGRVRVDSGAMDAREQANRTGSSMSASNALYQRFLRRLSDSALPPIPVHSRATF